jgi:hypothetical protein
MTIQLNILKALAVSVLIGCGGILGQSLGKRNVDSAVAMLGKGYVSNTAKVNGTPPPSWERRPSWPRFCRAAYVRAPSLIDNWTRSRMK